MRVGRGVRLLEGNFVGFGSGSVVGNRGFGKRYCVTTLIRSFSSLPLSRAKKNQIISLAVAAANFCLF